MLHAPAMSGQKQGNFPQGAAAAAAPIFEILLVYISCNSEGKAAVAYLHA